MARASLIFWEDHFKMNKQSFFTKVEHFRAPSTILFRSIELKLLRRYLYKYLKLSPVLDLGCGDGITASAVFSKKVAYGIDNDEYFLKIAKESGLYQKVLFADAQKIPLPNKAVNLVFSNSVIEHIKEQDAVLSEVARILKKNEFFLFTTPSNNFKKYSVFSFLKLNWLAKIYGEAREKKLNHYHSYSFLRWSRILDKQGFKVIKGYYYLDKQTTEFWDFLFILNKFFQLLMLINPKLFSWFYKIFLKQRIYKKFLEVQTTNASGAAVCLIAQKI